MADKASKLKEPPDLGFVELRTREARLAPRPAAGGRARTPQCARRRARVAEVPDAAGRTCERLVVGARDSRRRLASVTELGTSGDPARPMAAALAILAAG